jgi:hypothetical protein
VCGFLNSYIRVTCPSQHTDYCYNVCASLRVTEEVALVQNTCNYNSTYFINAVMNFVWLRAIPNWKCINNETIQPTHSSKPGSSVGIVTASLMTGEAGFYYQRERRCFSWLLCPDRLKDQPSPFSGNQEMFSLTQSDRGLQLDTHLRSVKFKDD